MKKQKLQWRITAGIALLLILITFTPLVIAPGRTSPKLFAMPYTLWTSMLIAIALVILTYIGGRIRFKNDE